MAKEKRFEPFLSVHFDAPSLFLALWSYWCFLVTQGAKDKVPSDLAHLTWYEPPANANRCFVGLTLGP